MTDVLRDFLLQHKKAALAFSGGTDSSYLLWEMTQCGIDVTAYYVHSPFQPAFELEDAKKVAAYAGAWMKVLEVNILDCAAVRENPANRCYFCKRQIFGTIRQAALADGYETLFDGTNASDDADDRPGMKALAEMNVLSPLRLCGLTKDEVRRRSKEAGLFTWNKPAYACLATRIPTGMPITAEELSRTEEAETILHRMGFCDFRVRTTREGNALVQVTAAQKEKAEAEWEMIRDALGKIYPDVMLDYLTRNGHGVYSIRDMADEKSFEKAEAMIRLMCELNAGIRSAEEDGWISEEDLRTHLHNRRFERGGI